MPPPAKGSDNCVFSCFVEKKTETNYLQFPDEPQVIFLIHFQAKHYFYAECCQTCFIKQRLKIEHWKCQNTAHWIFFSCQVPPIRHVFSGWIQSEVELNAKMLKVFPNSSCSSLTTPFYLHQCIVQQPFGHWNNNIFYQSRISYL